MNLHPVRTPGEVVLLAAAAAGATLTWCAADHATFTAGLLLALLLPMLQVVRSEAPGRGRSMVLGGAVLALAALHGMFPFSAPIAVLSLLAVGGCFPFHLWLESLRPHCSHRAYAMLLLTQPGLALAVHVLDPVTVTLDLAVRSQLTMAFVASALVHTGLALVRTEPMRAIAAIGLSQSALLVGGATVSEHGFTAEYLMLAGSDLGLLGLLVLLADLGRRHGPIRLAPDNGLGEVEGPSSQLFLVLGWLFVGLPGGVVFFAEDLLFHAFVTHSVAQSAGMILASVLNAVAFYRVYLGLFSGRMRPGMGPRGEMSPLHRAVAVGLILATLFFGFWPQLLLGASH